MSVGEVIDRQTVATRELVQIRHPARRIRVTLILERNDENPIKRRHFRLSSWVCERVRQLTDLNQSATCSSGLIRSQLDNGDYEENRCSEATKSHILKKSHA